MALSISACGVTSDAQQPTSSGNGSTYKQAEVVFKAWIPESTPAEAAVTLDILDEVTGLAIYPQRYQMTQSNGLLYEVHVPINVGSVIKYRFSKLSGIAIGEHTSLGTPVRYRMVKIDGPAIIEDVIFTWADAALSKPTGRIQGRIIDETTNLPVNGLMVSAGGLSTFTSAEGDYLLEGLPNGTHNLMTYSLDGKYAIYQQGAMVAAGATTPANIKVRPANEVTVTFITNTPTNASPGLPIRIAGNMVQFGNTFADLSAGFSTVESRMPLMTIREDGSYSYSIKLPVGFDLRYKYTLGDGFWNAEHYGDGNFRLRQLIVPNSDLVINDVIDSWSITDNPPFVFRLTTPENTPPTDTISIQFNPFDWTPPLEMWPIGSNQYIYVLYSPHQVLGDIQYRYCRNEQCDKSIGLLADKTAEQMLINQSLEQKDITDVISSWTNYQVLQNTPIVAMDILGRTPDFIAGFELSSKFSPYYQAHYIDALSSIYQSKANLILLSPTWSITHNTPPVFESIPGKDMLLSDINQLTGLIKETGVPLAIFPKFNSTGLDMDSWWMQAERSDGWWQSWFDRYRTFIINSALQAAQVQAKALVLNDGSINPALPSGILPDATPSGVPGDALGRWQRIIQDIRAVYPGELYWVVYADTDISKLSEIIVLVDKVIYADMDSAIVNTDNMAEGIAAVFNDKIKPVFDTTSKPLIVSITTSTDVTPERQAIFYQAVLEEINRQNWVAGVLSSEVNPSIRVQDNSGSVFGKPTMSILQYWYPFLVGQ